MPRLFVPLQRRLSAAVRDAVARISLCETAGRAMSAAGALLDVEASDPSGALATEPSTAESACVKVPLKLISKSFAQCTLKRRIEVQITCVFSRNSRLEQRASRLEQRVLAEVARISLMGSRSSLAARARLRVCALRVVFSTSCGASRSRSRRACYRVLNREKNVQDAQV